MQSHAPSASTTPACASQACVHDCCSRLEKVLEKWEIRMAAFEEKLEALPDRLCRAVEGQPPSKSTVQHVQHAMQQGMRAFLEAMTIPSRSAPTYPSTSPPPSPLEPVVAVPQVVPSPPQLLRTSSAHKASIANLMSSFNTSLPTSPSTPVAETAITHETSQPPIAHIPQTLPDKPRLPFEPPRPLYDVRPRIASSIQFALNSLTDDEVEPTSPERKKQPLSHTRQQQPPPSRRSSHSFLTPTKSGVTPVSVSCTPHALYDRPQESSWHPIKTESQSPSRPTFKWSDGTVRSAPEKWEFPSTTCRIMWQHWFLGDATVGIGPFRRLTSWDIERFARDNTSYKQLSRARTVMNKLVEIAVDHALLTSADEIEGVASAADLDALFVKTFEKFLETNPCDVAGSKLRSEKAWTYTYSSLHTLMAPTSRKRKHQATEPPPLPIAPPFQLPLQSTTAHTNNSS
ncbi:hypothetical protein H310_03676 [Aphanomyces invadans]|uniref:Uncharacterized protein n=1 Tax=Aphanomyces invadans TaxID=157072 RepID=A0A024UJP2_9STRA|nr:hypothetical protein H310_03676 [Aphanomyces invadans]ETW06082.1 hypothetical protein H310_03676 [Aphanomyces invadans]|eukprot:XP_008865859.1 hypothetical protein H310_03676 [Aphanomyces invadans]